jgi:LuxR family maltose regulon positive regulatory protein
MHQDSPVADTRSRADTRVLRAKLLAPSTRPGSVLRDEITELVTRSANAKLILFRAPAGFGKTTAMRQYMDHLGRHGVTTAWLTLDPLDDDFRRFLIHLIAAFNQIFTPSPVIATVNDVTGESPSVDQLAFDLMDRLADCDHAGTLFIDDMETVGNRSIVEFIRLIINRLPAHGQVVLASRETPNLPLGRLRAEGQLVEVDQFRLRFSAAETTSYLRTQRRLTLTDSDLSKLHQDTEGWPAALSLAATALENRPSPAYFIATFSGSNAAVAEYLAEDVLAQQLPEVRSFLLRTSILGELSKSLCDAVCGRTDSEKVLELLERSNVFVTVLDSERRLLRYHSLFADFLRSQLDLFFPKSIPELHLTAAHWFEAEGRPIPAIEHALRAVDIRYALEMLSANASELLFQGRFRLLARWLSALPSETLRAAPLLRMAQVWALTFTRHAGDALRLLETLENDRSSTLDEGILSQMEVLRPFILGILDRYEEAFWLAEETLLKESPRDNFSNSILHTTLASFRIASNRYSDAVALFNRPVPASPPGSPTFPTMYALCMEGLVELIQGRVHHAIAHFRVTLSEAGASFGSRSVGKSIAAIYLAEALYEIDELKEAEELLALYLPIAREYALPDQLIISHIVQARISNDRGDADHAFLRLSELEYLGRHSNLPRLLAAAQLERARIAMLSGSFADAQNHCERAENPDAWSSLRGMIMPANDVETKELARFRLRLHSGDNGRLAEELKVACAVAHGQSRIRRFIKLGILLAKALQASGQARPAMRKLREVLQLAAPEGLMRTFIDEGAPIIDLLSEYRSSRGAAERSQGDEADRFVDLILARAGRSLDVGSREAPSGDSAALTLRELQILESVALGMSNKAIAKRLFVTETTVRSHLRKINVKLGVGNRTQAVNVARRAGVLHP